MSLDPQSAWPFPNSPSRSEVFGKKYPNGAVIVRVKIAKLFGLYDYDILGDRKALKTPILYGENGLGKTNILKILFHLLSAGEDKGHRTALGEIKFQSVEVWLSNGICVTSRRSSRLLGSMRLEVHQHGVEGALAGWNWYSKDDPEGEDNGLLKGVDLEKVEAQLGKRQKTRALQTILIDAYEKRKDAHEGEHAFIEALSDNVPPLYFLTADRIMLADNIASTRYSVNETGRHFTAEEMVKRGRSRALSEAINSASRELSLLGVESARAGSHSMHAIYAELIRRLADNSSKSEVDKHLPMEILLDDLVRLSSFYTMYAEFGLATKFDGQKLAAALRTIPSESRALASSVVSPYVESLSKQAAQLSEAYDVIYTLVSTVNDFLFDKKLNFMMGRGIFVSGTGRGVFDPNELSSGEQQLLLLFLQITIARESGGIFIIDEPEISLNVKWQRKLVDSLIQLDGKKRLQFFLASHSIELLTKHFVSVVPLGDERNG